MHVDPNHNHGAQANLPILNVDQVVTAAAKLAAAERAQDIEAAKKQKADVRAKQERSVEVEGQRDSKIDSVRASLVALNATPEVQSMAKALGALEDHLERNHHLGDHQRHILTVPLSTAEVCLKSGDPSEHEGGLVLSRKGICLSRTHAYSQSECVYTSSWMEPIKPKGLWLSLKSALGSKAGHSLAGVDLDDVRRRLSLASLELSKVTPEGPIDDGLIYVVHSRSSKYSPAKQLPERAKLAHSDAETSAPLR